MGKIISYTLLGLAFFGPLIGWLATELSGNDGDLGLMVFLAWSGPLCIGSVYTYHNT